MRQIIYLFFHLLKMNNNCYLTRLLQGWHLKATTLGLIHGRYSVHIVFFSFQKCLSINRTRQNRNRVDDFQVTLKVISNLSSSDQWFINERLSLHQFSCVSYSILFFVGIQEAQESVGNALPSFVPCFLAPTVPCHLLTILPGAFPLSLSAVVCSPTSSVCFFHIQYVAQFISPEVIPSTEANVRVDE